MAFSFPLFFEIFPQEIKHLLKRFTILQKLSNLIHLSRIRDIQMRETDKTNPTGHGQADKTHIEFKSIALKGLFMIAFF